MGRVLVAILCLTGAAQFSHACAQIVVPCADDETREQVRALVLEGLDAALRNQMTKLFEIWMRDAHEMPPRRATLGMNLAVNSYMRARAGALAWNPPLCP
jgi:hypothetical protein